MIKELFSVLDKFALKSKEKEEWNIVGGDIVINKKKYREIKQEFLNKIQ